MDLVIENQKILDYLLKPLEKADKSKFLNIIGYTPQNWLLLKSDILSQFSEYPTAMQEQTPYGTLFHIEGTLRAPLKTVEITTVWIQLPDTNVLKLVTLYPNKK